MALCRRDGLWWIDLAAPSRSDDGAPFVRMFKEPTRHTRFLTRKEIRKPRATTTTIAATAHSMGRLPTSGSWPRNTGQRVTEVLDTNNLYAQANLRSKGEALERLEPPLSRPPRWTRHAGLLEWLESL